METTLLNVVVFLSTLYKWAWPSGKCGIKYLVLILSNSCEAKRIFVVEALIEKLSCDKDENAGPSTR